MTKQLWSIIIIGCIFAIGCAKKNLDIIQDENIKKKNNVADLYQCDEKYTAN